jgi:asparagine synthase (glutamine-hydrolysing)
MCGISGIFNFALDKPVEIETLEKMNEIQRHRGPDDVGIYLNRQVGLGNRRLSIIDREHGRQPMSNEEGSVWITYNGEIFNYRQLRHLLKGRGYRFKTDSDTEVVLHAYEAFGEDCVTQFNGQFAFAIWDHPRKKLFLARDRMGIVPLHYTITDGQFIFASEAKAILEHPAISPDINLEAVAEVLLCSTLLEDHTLFKGIWTLPPGYTLTAMAHTGRPGFHYRLKKYWEIPFPEAIQPIPFIGEDTERYYGQCLMELLKEAIQLRLVGEVPLGVLLSGGTDSSTIATWASQLLPGSLQTFTIDFPNPWKGEDHDATYARLVAQTLGTKHHEFLVSPEAYFSILERLTWHLERPFNKGAATMYLLYEKLKDYATVVLCGEGADELLAGYLGSRGLGLDDSVKTQQITYFPWAPSWKVMLQLFSQEFREAVRPEELFFQKLSDQLIRVSHQDILFQALYLYLKFFLLELLEFHDRTSLAFGVETRPPFLDHRLVELLAPMPSELKVKNGQGKYIFKKMLQGFLPDSILYRKKTHMPIPRDPSSVFHQLQLTRDLLLSPNSRAISYFDRMQLVDFLERKNEFEGIDLLTLWQISMYLLTLELLHRVYRV